MGKVDLRMCISLFFKMSECVSNNMEVDIGVESTTETDGHSEQHLDAHEQVYGTA